MANNTDNSMPVIKDLRDFDSHSGNSLERAVFNHRHFFVLLMVVVTAIMSYMAITRLEIRPSFEKMIPQSHPFIQNYLEQRSSLNGLGNAVRVVVEAKEGDIFDAEYLKVLQRVHDKLFLTPGVDRAWMKSLWSPSVRWTEITEEGYQGGPVIPNTYSGTPADIEQLRENINRAGIIGSIVSNDLKSTMLIVPLLDRDTATGNSVDYHTFSKVLENELRVAIEGESQSGKYNVRIIGFAKLIGDLIDGLLQVMGFFALAVASSFFIIFYFTRCARSTALVICCSLIAVVWQLGIIAWMGYAIDPYSILVPFLIFAIGVSHAAQKMNGIMQDIAAGTHKLIAARYTFRRLFMAGLTALLCDAVGFAVLMMIDIPVIRELAMTASIGVAVLTFTNLLLMPVALSYIGVSPKAAVRTLNLERAAVEGTGGGRMWQVLGLFTTKRYAIAAIVLSGALGCFGFAVSLNLKIGDLDAGAPELHEYSRYNVDNAYITEHFGLSNDQFVVMVKTKKDGCMAYETLVLADRLAWQMQQYPGVQTSVSLVNSVRQITAGSFEGNPKFFSIQRNPDMLNYAAQQTAVNTPGVFNSDCSVMPIVVYLKDHKAETLDAVVEIAERFARENNSENHEFLLAAGNSGIEAATNIVVRDANRTMLMYVYIAVFILCLIAFKSLAAAMVAIIPLILTSILCEALMVAMGIGVKVATLPVIALGVGIGIDYALYLLSAQMAFQAKGYPLAEAYRKALAFTGRMVALVGVTLSVGVITWIWSPIKFQADMGLLLAFMFLWNMLGALLLIPALSYFLLPTKKVLAPTGNNRAAS